LLGINGAATLVFLSGNPREFMSDGKSSGMEGTDNGEKKDKREFCLCSRVLLLLELNLVEVVLELLVVIVFLL